MFFNTNNIWSLIKHTHRSAVAWTMIVALVRIGGLLACLPIVARHVSSAEYGLWQLLLAYTGISALIDIGFGPAAERAVSFAWGGAKVLKALGHYAVSEDENSEPNYKLLAELIKTISGYYAALSIVTLVLALGVASSSIWHKTTDLPHPISLRVASVVFIIFMSLGVITYYWNICLIGINRVKEAQVTMLLGLIINYSILIAGLFCGAGIWALVSSQIVMMAWNRYRSREYFLRSAGEQFMIAYRDARMSKEIIMTLWPIAWRTGLTTFGSYMINQGSLIEASMLGVGLSSLGSYGLTKQAFSVVAQLSSTWTSTKAPLIYQWRSQGRDRDIWHLFKKRLILQWITWAVCAIGLIIIGPRLIHLLRSKIDLLSCSMMIWMAIIGLLESNHQSFGILIYSENKNPLAGLTIVTGIIILAIGFFLIANHHIWGLLIAQGVGFALIANWWIPWRAYKALITKNTN
ncbi:MAG: hypothetical protein K8R57_08000 [Verrucomicrobia bacterium]|nr:hypothetical protein [Verrucomicrobiota bacterium]